MAPTSLRSVAFWLLHIASSFRFHKHAIGPGDVESIGCPVLSSLIKNKIMREDAYGRVSQNMTIYALKAMGSSDMMALFQSKGIAGYAADDIHQNVRVKFSKDSDRHLNYRTLNRQDHCSKGGPSTLPAGTPCNANIAFVQHGYSTMLRDPQGGATEKERFDNWFEKPGVLTRCRKCVGLFGGKVMKLEGMGKLLSYARGLDGDHSGEFSLNADGSFAGSSFERFHPSITHPSDTSVVSTWQAVMAWSAFWVAFAHEKNGEVFMPYDDLKTFFVEGDFPKGWVKKPWGWRETWATAAALEGSGAGDGWSARSRGVLEKVGREADETTYFYQMIEVLGSLNTQADDIYNTYP